MRGGAESREIGVDEGRPFRVQRSLEGAAEVLDRAHALRREAEALADLHEVRRREVDADAPALELTVLDAPEDAVALVVEEDDLDGGGELAEVEHEAAVAAEGDALAVRPSELRADGQGQAGPNGVGACVDG